jgi:hypothetical protein
MPAKVRNDAVSQSTSELEVELIRNLIKRHKHITILLVDNEVTDSFRRAVGKEPRLKIKPVDTHAAEGFLVIYAEDTGHFAELSSVIDVSVRDVAHRFTLSPDTILRPANTLRGIEMSEFLRRIATPKFNSIGINSPLEILASRIRKAKVALG